MLIILVGIIEYLRQEWEPSVLHYFGMIILIILIAPCSLSQWLQQLQRVDHLIFALKIFPIPNSCTSFHRRSRLHFSSFERDRMAEVLACVLGSRVGPISARESHSSLWIVPVCRCILHTHYVLVSAATKPGSSSWCGALKLSSGWQNNETRSRLGAHRYSQGDFLMLQLGLFHQNWKGRDWVVCLLTFPGKSLFEHS